MTILKRAQEGLFGALWRLVSSAPGTLVVFCVLLAVVSVLAASRYLVMDSDQDRLISPDLPYHKKYLEQLENFGDQEYLYVVIGAGGTEEGKKAASRFAESMARRLRDHPELIQAMYYRISAKDLGDGALLYAPLEDAGKISDAVRFLAPHARKWFQDGTLAGLFDRMSDLISDGEGGLSEVEPAVFGQTLAGLAGLLATIDNTLRGKPSGDVEFDLAGSGSRYFFTSNDKLLIMQVLPNKDFETLDVIGEPLKAIRQALEATRVEYPGVRAGLTGRPVLQADEMQTTNRDMTRASLTAFLLVGFLFVLILHGWLRPVLIMFSLGLAMAWTYGFATLAVGRLNLLSVVFVLVLVGIGVEYGVHIMMRYMEGAKGGLGVEGAVRNSISRTGPGVLLSATTTVCAFYSVLGSDFVGLAELGLIGGTGILLCMLAMLTLLPALLLILGRKNLLPASEPRVVAMPFLERFSDRGGLLLLIIAGISVAALPALYRTRFSYNLLELQAKGLESVEYERRLIEESDESTWYAIFTAGTAEEGESLSETLAGLPSVGKVESILDYVPEHQKEKKALFAQAARELENIPASAAAPSSPGPDSLLRSFTRFSFALEALEEKLFAAGAGTELALLDRTLEDLRSSADLLRQDPGRAALLTDLQESLRREVETGIRQVKLWLSAESVNIHDLPPSLRGIYVGKDGRMQIKVSPKGDVWDFENLERFVAELRRVDPEISGVPVGVLEAASLMHRTFLSAAGLTLLLVSLILWGATRSLRQVLFTLLPLGVGMLWLLELMGFLGLSFNLANFFSIPILIGNGVDGGVHILVRWRELDGKGSLFSTSTPAAVALSFGTTMIGFGGLLLAHHRGLASLGAVMVIGSFTSMLACLLVLPAALKLSGTFLKE